jgi:DNA polymerase III epsilon subunit-like protein
MKKNALLYIDTETTGLKAGRHAIMQLAVIAVIDGEVAGTFEAKIDPTTYPLIEEYDEKALEINGFGRIADALLDRASGREVEEDIDLSEWEDSAMVFNEFVEWIEALRQKREVEKWQPVGYNPAFDLGFLEVWMKGHGGDLYDIVSHRALDVMGLVRHLIAVGHFSPRSGSLGNACRAAGVTIFDAHDAMADIRATRELYRTLSSRYLAPVPMEDGATMPAGELL